MMKILALLALWLILLSGMALAQTSQTATMNLSWEYTATNHTGFKIERCTGSGCTNFAQVGTGIASDRAFTDVIVNDPGNVTQRYRVKAFNTAGDSPPSNIADGTSPIIVIKPPTGIPSNIQVQVTVTVNIVP